MRVQPLDFRPPLSFPFRTHDLAFELLGPSIGPAILISKFVSFSRRRTACAPLCVCMLTMPFLLTMMMRFLGGNPSPRFWKKNKAEQCNAAPALLRNASNILAFISQLGRCCRRFLGNAAENMPAAYNGIFYNGLHIWIWLKPLIVLNMVLYLKLCWNKVRQNHITHYYGNFIRIKVINCSGDTGFPFREV